MRHPAHVFLIRLGAALDQQRRFFGQRRQELRHPAGRGITFVRLEVTQDPVQHQILVAGMADADPYPAIVLADMGVDVAQPVVAPAPPPFFMRTRPGAMSSSSWNTTMRSSGTFRKRTASPTALADSFMKVMGFNTMTRSPPR